MILSLIIGILTAGGVYMILRRNFVKVILGFMLLAHAANLVIFKVGGLTRGEPAFVEEGASAIAEPFADPLPQALILTAIVIGFGVQAYAIVLFKRSYQATGSDDIDTLNTTDSIDYDK